MLPLRVPFTRQIAEKVIWIVPKRPPVLPVQHEVENRLVPLLLDARPRPLRLAQLGREFLAPHSSSDHLGAIPHRLAVQPRQLVAVRWRRLRSFEMAKQGAEACLALARRVREVEELFEEPRVSKGRFCEKSATHLPPKMIRPLFFRDLLLSALDPCGLLLSLASPYTRSRRADVDTLELSSNVELADLSRPSLLEEVFLPRLRKDFARALLGCGGISQNEDYKLERGSKLPYKRVRCATPGRDPFASLQCGRDRLVALWPPATAAPVTSRFAEKPS